MIISNNYKQNSKDWYAWRGKGIGASDAPTIMGVSPWSTPFELWAEKTGLLPRPEANPYAVAAMKRGTDMEPEARAAYEKKFGIKMEPANAEHGTYSFIRASLDGYNKNLNKLLEIKCPGKEAHATAVKGKVPKYYIDQLQHQFLVTGATSGDYWSFDGKEGVCVPILPDPEYQAKLLSALIAFWECVQTKTPPQISSKDLTKLVDNIGKELERISKYYEGLRLLTDAIAEKKARKNQ